MNHDSHSTMHRSIDVTHNADVESYRTESIKSQASPVDIARALLDTISSQQKLFSEQLGAIRQDQETVSGELKNDETLMSAAMDTNHLRERELTSELDRIRAEKGDLKSRLGHVEQQIARIHEMREKYDALQSEITAARTEVQKAQALGQLFESTSQALEEVTSHKDELEGRLHTLLEHHEQVEEQRDDLHQAANALKQRLEAVQAQHIKEKQDLSEDLDSSRRAAADVRQTRYRLKNELLSLEQKHEKVLDQHVRSQHQVGQMAAEISQLRESISPLEQQNHAVVQSLEAARSEVDELADQNTTVKCQQKQLKQQLGDSESECGRLQDAVSNLQQRLHSPDQQHSQERQQLLEELKNAISQADVASRAREQLNQDLESIQIELSDVRKEFDSTEQRLQSRHVESGQLQNSMVELRHEFQVLQDKSREERQRLSKSLQSAEEELAQATIQLDSMQQPAQSLDATMAELAKVIAERDAMRDDLETLQKKYDSSEQEHLQNKDRLRTTVNSVLKEAKVLSERTQKEQDSAHAELLALQDDYQQVQRRLRLKQGETNSGGRSSYHVDPPGEAGLCDVFTRLRVRETDGSQPSRKAG